MSLENCNNFVNIKNNIPQKVVNIPISLYESIQQKYFVGQTKALLVGKDCTSWAGLVNPCDSNVNLYVNVSTISNFSDENLTAEIWLNTDFPEKGSVSHKISPTNTASSGFTKNEVDIRFIKSTTRTPESGVNVYERIIPPNTTIILEEDGKFIEAPGGSYVVVIKSPSETIDKVIVAFGWWETSI